MKLEVDRSYRSSLSSPSRRLEMKTAEVQSSVDQRPGGRGHAVKCGNQDINISHPALSYILNEIRPLIVNALLKTN